MFLPVFAERFDIVEVEVLFLREFVSPGLWDLSSIGLVTQTPCCVSIARLDCIGLADERVFELAGRHFQAFFYFITYNHAQNRGWWWKGMFAQILAVSKPDWGNHLAMAFMRETRHWDHRVLAITAEEHFKLVIRKHLTQDVWSLAVEWNESFRVFAACGEEAPLRAFVDALPSLQLQTISQNSNSGLAARTEKKLNDEDDVLFAQAPSDAVTAAR
ncbi:hypothetical protein [Bradyrhizobium sp. ERR14]|uniref:hypothetical protein n=1 Tax=Bradyrhizobium sp. ERR14 TaxID=2663837 RepID=UPI00161D53A5|nr:hypothetical protein [Bradyrhizobium sp. ERR14]MBB4397944.1 hypothetical protein [Bradyrhizobium sp. ERR14]